MSKVPIVVAEPSGAADYGGHYSGGDSSSQAGHPPTGKWRDGLFDCMKNLWPSCGCCCIFHGVWIVGQMAQKTTCAKFNSIVMPYMIIYILCAILAMIFGTGLYFIPAGLVFLVQIALRLHVVKYYNITEYGTFVEFLAAFFCCPCSIAQMARHIYGYTLVFDGDSKPDLDDLYNSPANRV